jgi:nicotinate phosphoribosyltransferase
MAGMATPGALDTDLYQLTMLAGYDAARLDARATFELYVRSLPADRHYLVAAGLDQALEYLEALRFTDAQLAWLRRLPVFAHVAPSFFDDTLRNLRFTGDVWAMPEGTPFFEYEPVLRVTAPLIEAQLAETALLAIVNFQTLIASKAARIVDAADGRRVLEFGTRRAHGTEAGVLAARAAYLAGCAATSNVEAGQRFGIPVSGTMAHSWVTTFTDEEEAFRTFAGVFRERAVFLIDTFDTVAAARKVVAAGLRPMSVRIDSGDLIALSRAVRRILDEGGLKTTQIVASGDLDEWSIAEALAKQAPIDAFGVGTALSTSRDAPSLGGIYKLVEVERGDAPVPVMKLSGGKASYPGRKQVWRRVKAGTAYGDVIGLEDEAGPADGLPLLMPFMKHGERVMPREPLDALRARHRDAMQLLPTGVRMLHVLEAYPVARTHKLEALTDYTVQSLRT